MGQHLKVVDYLKEVADYFVTKLSFCNAIKKNQYNNILSSEY